MEQSIAKWLLESARRDLREASLQLPELERVAEDMATRARGDNGFSPEVWATEATKTRRELRNAKKRCGMLRNVVKELKRACKTKGVKVP